MAIANPQWIGIAHGRHYQDVIDFCRAQGRPFIYFRENPAQTGTWFGCGSAGVEVTTGITNKNDINGALQAAAASALV
jgi:hypothetical protein